MAEPASTSAGGIAVGISVGKLVGGLLGIGFVATVLGFLVLPPKSAQEAFVRFLATFTGSALVGPFIVVGVYAKWPEIFTAAAHVAATMGLPAWAGTLIVGAPLLAMGGLPFWWLLGALVLWLERRRGKDIGELAQDAAADVKKAVLP